MNERVEAVQRMQDYIEAHVFETITPADLARASLYSPWYSYRLFSQYLDTTPAEYIRRLRLSKSALMLQDESVKIADIAFLVGYNSVDGYQRAFLREFGCNPKEYADNPVPVYLFTPYGIKYKEAWRKNSMETVRTVLIQTIEKPARKVIIKRGIGAEDYWAYCNEVGCDVWGLLKSMKSLCGEPVCLWLPEAYRKPGTSKYVQGVEVSADYAGSVPEGFDVIDLPACKYQMFQGEPFEEEDYCAAIEAVQTVMNKYDPTPAGYTLDTANPRIQLEPVGSRGYIELLPVK